MFGLWKRKPKIGGKIGYYGLQEWWLASFSETERKWAESVYAPMGESTTLTTGEIKFSTSGIVHFLTYATPWFSKPGHHTVALKFADKLYETIHGADDIDRHFGYHTLCRVYYRWRDVDMGALEKAIEACEASVGMAHGFGGKIDAGRTGVPIQVGHHCYEQLIVIEKKRGNLDRALALCHRAEIEGWAGDWQRKISSLERLKARSA